MTAPGTAGERSAAVRVDADHRDEMEFLGPPGAKMLLCTHVPARPPTGGVVICSSVRAELETNYRREILLGRALAAAGIVVQRFQYLGTGNSDGDTHGVTLATMEADARAAARVLVERTGVQRLAFVGTRVGAIVAASVAAEHEGSPVVLWEPVTDGRRYVREVLRARRFWAANQESIEAPSEGAMEELRRTGELDVLGYPIGSALVDGIVESSVERAMDASGRAVLVVQMGGRRGLRRDYEALASRWRTAGAAIECAVVDEQESWWLEHPGERQEKRLLTTSPAIDTTLAWVGERLGVAEVRR